MANRGVNMATTKRLKIEKVCKYSAGSPYPNEPIGYNWLDFSYPCYHIHEDFWELLLITNGEAENLINGTNHHLCANDMVLLRPNDAHSIVNCENTNCKHLSIAIKSEYIQQYLGLFGEKLYENLLSMETPCFLTLKNNVLEDVVETLLSIYSIHLPFDEKMLKLKLKANLLINIIVDNQISNHQNFPEWLNKFLFTLNNPKSEISNVKHLALQTNYSYQRLSVIFKNLTGKTIIEYSTDIKLKHAKHLLINSYLSITEIAMELNYDSVSHFIRLFKKKYGMTPKQFKLKYS